MSKTKETIVIVKKDTMEIPSMRTEFSKTFYVTDTERRLEASRSPIHVQNKKGEWDDITCEIKNNKPTKCPYKAKMLKDKVGYQMHKDDMFIEMEIDVPYKEPVVEGNMSTWKNITPGVDVVLAFGPTSVQFFRVVKNKSARKSFDYRIIINEKQAEHLSFAGQDSEGKEIHLEQKEKSTKKIKRNGLDLVEKVITDTFLKEVTDMDEVTRKRFWSKNVKYPVMIH